MRRLVLPLLLSVLVIFACQKEDDVITTPKLTGVDIELQKDLVQDYNSLRVDWGGQRNGEKQLVFYINTVSERDVLGAATTIVQAAFNHVKVDSVSLVKYKPEIVTIDGVKCGYYNRTIKYKDGSNSTTEKRLAKNSGDIFKYKVTNPNTLIDNTSPSKYMKLTLLSENITYWDFFYDKSKKQYKSNMDTDTGFKGSAFFRSETTSNIFSFKHIH